MCRASPWRCVGSSSGQQNRRNVSTCNVIDCFRKLRAVNYTKENKIQEVQRRREKRDIDFIFSSSISARIILWTFKNSLAKLSRKIFRYIFPIINFLLCERDLRNLTRGRMYLHSLRSRLNALRGNTVAMFDDV